MKQTVEKPISSDFRELKDEDLSMVTGGTMTAAEQVSQYTKKMLEQGNHPKYAKVNTSSSDTVDKTSVEMVWDPSDHLK